MKIALLLLLAFLAVASTTFSGEEESIEPVLLKNAKFHNLKNFIDKILKKALEKIRSIIQEQGYISVPDLPIKNISDSNVQINLLLTNVVVYNASTFVVKKLKNNFFKMTETFDFFFPTLDITGDYNVTGKILGNNVSGSGDFKVDVQNLDTSGKAYATIKKGSVQLKKLDLDYSLTGVTATATGLTVEGLTPAQVNELLSNALYGYFTDNERLVSDTISAKVIDISNNFLQGMSLSDLIKWLEHFIHPSSIEMK